ncbi:hypothetical protein RJG79_09100 [Mycoplasmatota bacterium WC44]
MEEIMEFITIPLLLLIIFFSIIAFIVKMVVKTALNEVKEDIIKEIKLMKNGNADIGIKINED